MEVEGIRILGFSELLPERVQPEEDARVWAARREQALRALEVELAATTKKLAEVRSRYADTGRAGIMQS